MPRRVREELKNEMIIRGLLRQPDNMRCINCNSLGPQYVCTTFWTFVCSSCSGVHREFNHRVKSVSTSKFSDEEIMSLQAGGNERAKEIYFKTWDPECDNYPGSGNRKMIREFINEVYVERQYCGGNNSNKLAMVSLDSRSRSCVWPFEKSSWGRRDELFGSPSSERTGHSGRDDLDYYSSFEKSSPSHCKKVLNLSDFLEERSPRSTQENVRSSSIRSRSTRLVIVDDRFRENGSVKHYERHSRKGSRDGSMSPASQRSRATSPHGVRSVKAVSGEKDSELRIEGPPRTNDGNHSSSHKADDATIPGPSGGKEEQDKARTSCNLIDFSDAETEPASDPVKPQAQPVASNTNGQGTTQVAASVQNMNSVDSLLMELSGPVTPPSTAAQTNSPMTNSQIQQLPSNQKSQTSVAPPGNTDSNSLQSATSVESLSNQDSNKSPQSNDPSLQIVPFEKSVQAVNPGEGSSPCARKEIPQEHFASNFTSFYPAVAGWHMHPHYAAGYGMPLHPHAMTAAAFPSSPKPTNPFDIDDGIYPVQAFPSMSPLQAALPNMPPSTALESQPSPYVTAVVPSQFHMSPYVMNMPLVPPAYMGQLPNNMPLTRPQGNANFGRSEDPFTSLNPLQQSSGSDSSPAAPTSPLPRAGNPFEL